MMDSRDIICFFSWLYDDFIGYYSPHLCEISIYVFFQPFLAFGHCSDLEKISLSPGMARALGGFGFLVCHRDLSVTLCEAGRQSVSLIFLQSRPQIVGVL